MYLGQREGLWYYTMLVESYRGVWGTNNVKAMPPVARMPQRIVFGDDMLNTTIEQSSFKASESIRIFRGRERAMSMNWHESDAARVF